MKRGLLITVILTLIAAHFGVCSHAAVRDCDFSVPADLDIDGSDLAQFIAHYSATPPNSASDVNGDGSIDSNDAAHFAGFFGQAYTVTARPPNILLIIADDVGLDVTTNMYPNLITNLLQKYGPEYHDLIDGKPASTPVLDQLAQQGMRFSNAWAQPFCSPTRASIITGLFTAKHDVTTYATYLGSNHTTFVRMLKEGAIYGGSNYSTAAFGKWHVAGVPVNSTSGMMPKKAGFELYKGGLGAAPNSFWTNYEYVVQDDSTTDTGTKPGNLQPRSLPAGTSPAIASTTYAPVVKAADTIQWLNERQAENPDKPWFAYLAFNLSHATSGTPMMVVPNRDTLDCDRNVSACQEIVNCGGQFGGTSIGQCDGKELMRAMTTSMDTVIGKVLDVVDSLDSDTYVIYIADNGTPMYSFSPALGYQIDNMYITSTNRGKGTAYESGARVPLVIRGPGISAGSESGEFVHAADLFSTILELAGLEPPVNVPNSSGAMVPVDAVSLAPIIYDSTSAVRHPNNDYILTDAENIMPGSTTGGKWAGARNATYKVVCKDGTSTSDCEFYNLENDPLEEYKLDEHETSSCESIGTGTPEWHYCHLIGIIKNYSILSP